VLHIVDGRERWAFANATGFFRERLPGSVLGSSRGHHRAEARGRRTAGTIGPACRTLEQERTRIAREIHDELGQQLTALKFEAAAWESGTRTRQGPSDPEDRRRHPGVRRIATELRPAILDHFGLVAAIEWMANDFSRRQASSAIANWIPPFK
jgi:signal transduction histidine kinase